MGENFKHGEYEKKKVKNNYSRVRKRRPRKILLLSHKKTSSFHFEIQNTNSMDKKREKIIILTFDNITNLPKITLIPPQYPILVLWNAKNQLFVFFFFICLC